jgi:hypothetical protein
MLKFEAKDLVVRLDEKRRVLQFLVPKGGADSGELRVFYEMSEDDFDANQFEHQIGVALLAFLSATYSSDAFHLGQYRDAAKNLTGKWEAERSQDLKSKSAKGDAAAKYELAMQRIAQGLRTKSRAAMNEADVLIKEAASSGDRQASEYLANLWPALKDRSDRSFK